MPKNGTAPDLKPALKILDSRPTVGAGDLIPLLQDLQEAYGYLPPPVLLEVSRRTGLPASRIYGVVTFYSQFYLEPHGKHTIRVCRGTACHVRGGMEVLDAVRSALNIDDGGTTEDMRFSLETVACLGTCFLAPVMMIDNAYYGQLTPARLKSIVDNYEG